MTELLDTLLTELERFGKANDGATAERPRRMLNITRDTGEFLAVLIRATLARRVLEYVAVSHELSAARPTATRHSGSRAPRERSVGR